MTRYSDRLDDVEQRIAAQTSVAPLMPAAGCDSGAPRPAGTALALRPPPSVLQRPGIFQANAGTDPQSGANFGQKAAASCGGRYLVPTGIERLGGIGSAKQRGEKSEQKAIDALTCPRCGHAKVPDTTGHRHTGHLCFFCGYDTDAGQSPQRAQNSERKAEVTMELPALTGPTRFVTGCDGFGCGSQPCTCEPNRGTHSDTWLRGYARGEKDFRAGVTECPFVEGSINDWVGAWRAGYTAEHARVWGRAEVCGCLDSQHRTGAATVEECLDRQSGQATRFVQPGPAVPGAGGGGRGGLVAREGQVLVVHCEGIYSVGGSGGGGSWGPNGDPVVVERWGGGGGADVDVPGAMVAMVRGTWPGSRTMQRVADRIEELELAVTVAERRNLGLRQQFTNACEQLAAARLELEMQGAAEPAEAVIVRGRNEHGDWCNERIEAGQTGIVRWTEVDRVDPAADWCNCRTGGHLIADCPQSIFRGVATADCGEMDWLKIHSRWEAIIVTEPGPVVQMTETLATPEKVAGHVFEGFGSSRLCVAPDCKAQKGVFWDSLSAVTAAEIGKPGWSHDGLTLSDAEYKQFEKERDRMDRIAAAMTGGVRS